MSTESTRGCAPGQRVVTIASTHKSSTFVSCSRIHGTTISISPVITTEGLEIVACADAAWLATVREHDVMTAKRNE